MTQSGRMSVLAVGVLLVGAAAAEAAKWNNGCPAAPMPVYPSTRGAVTAPFVHPGHEIGIVLSEVELLGSGGFSTVPGGNTIEVIFDSLFGASVAVPPFTAAGTSPSTLYFKFPNTAAAVGRLLAGPVQVQVSTTTGVVAAISSRHLVALPPDNDVRDIVLTGGTRDALATLDVRGDVWIPLQFRNFGVAQMDMPGCPLTDFIHKTAFAVGVNVRANMGETAEFASYPPFRSIRRADVFLGDFDVDGFNAYGADLERRLPLLRIPRGFGVSICALNDAVNLVVRARGKRRWARAGSGFSAWVAGSEPLAVTIADVTAEPITLDMLRSLPFDSFGTSCLLQ